MPYRTLSNLRTPSPPRTYYRSSPERIDTFFATRRRLASSSLGEDGGEVVPELTMSSDEEDSEDEEEDEEGDGRSGVVPAWRNGARARRGGRKDEAEQREYIVPSLTHLITHPPQPCTSCSTPSTPLTQHWVLLLPCSDLTCLPCLNSLISATSNDPSRPGKCFVHGVLVEGFEGVRFVDEMAEREKEEMEVKMVDGGFRTPEKKREKGWKWSWSEEESGSSLGSPMSEGRSFGFKSPFSTPSSPASVSSFGGGGSSRSLSVEVPRPRAWSVVRVDNIPWSITVPDVLEWLPSTVPLLPPESCPINILCNRGDGRTLSQLYISLPTLSAAQTIVRLQKGRKLLGRPVSVVLATAKEVREQIFPDWEPGFDGVDALEPWTEGTVLSLSDVEGLIELCSLESPHLVKVPERVFLQFASILSHLPFHQQEVYDAKLVAALYHGVEVALSTMPHSFGEGEKGIEDAKRTAKTLLSTALSCPVFRASQKSALLSFVGLSSAPSSPSSHPVRTPFSTPPSLHTPASSPTKSSPHSPSSPSPLRRSILSSSSAASLPSRRGESLRAANEEEEGEEEKVVRLSKELDVEEVMVRKVLGGLERC